MEVRANDRFDRMKPQRGRTFEIAWQANEPLVRTKRHFGWRIMGMAGGAGLSLAMIFASAGGVSG